MLKKQDKLKRMLKKILKTILQYLLAIMISLVIALLLRIFAVDFYSIPSDSMEPTLQPGDFIVVNKLCYGARVYKNFKFLDDGSEPPTYRVKGFSKVKHNDVIVFNYPYHKRRDTIKMNLSTFYVKRCIALPGDSLCIANGFYKVNGKKGFGNMDNQEMLSSWPGFQGIYRYTISPSYIEPKWDVKNFGPLVIPGKGITLPIDTGNISLYRRPITFETGGNITVGNGRVRLDGQPLDSYTFTQNWYFMAGDNVVNSQDSRYIGMVPEKYLVGKVVRILTAKDKETGKYRWNRFLKKVK